MKVWWRSTSGWRALIAIGIRHVAELIHQAACARPPARAQRESRSSYSLLEAVSAQVLMGQTEVRQIAMAEGAPSGRVPDRRSLSSLGLSKAVAKGWALKPPGFTGLAPRRNDAWVMPSVWSRRCKVQSAKSSAGPQLPGHRRRRNAPGIRSMVPAASTGRRPVLAPPEDRGAAPADSAVPSPAGPYAARAAAGQGGAISTAMAIEAMTLGGPAVARAQHHQQKPAHRASTAESATNKEHRQVRCRGHRHHDARGARLARQARG